MFNLLKNKAYFKMIVTTSLGALIIMSSMFMHHQNKKIEHLQDELYCKQQSEQIASDYYRSELNVKTIQTKLNSLQEYSVMKDCTINMEHQYEHSKDGVMGVRKKANYKGIGTLQYDVNVNLGGSVVSINNNGKDILIQIPEPYVDTNSVKLMQNTLLMSETNNNIWMNRSDVAYAQRLFNDSFVDSGTKKILKLYDNEAKMQEARRAATTEVHKLIRTLEIYGDVNVVVKVMEN